jgi:hypothetical protein
MEELIKKYDITIPQLIMIGRIEEWTFKEMEDLDYIEERIIVNLELRT